MTQNVMLMGIWAGRMMWTRRTALIQVVMWTWKGTVTMKRRKMTRRKIQRRKMTRRRRRRIRMRLMPNNLGRLAREWWSIHSADDVDTVVDDHRIVLSEQGLEMREHTPRQQPLAPAPRSQTPETHPLSGLEHLGLATPQKPRLAVPTQREAEAAGNTSDGDVDQQLLLRSAGGDGLPNVPLPDVPLPDVPLPDVPLPNVPLPDVPLPDVPHPKAHPDGSVGEEWTSPRVAEEAMVVAFVLGSGSCLVRFLCSNLSISAIDENTRRNVSVSLKVYFIYGFCIGFIFLVLFYS